MIRKHSFISNNKNKNVPVDIEISAHDMFLKLPSSGTLIVRMENLIIKKYLEASKPEGIRMITKNG